MKIDSTIYSPPQAILCVYDFILSNKYRVIFKINILALPNFIIGVKGCRDLKAHPSIHNKVIGGK